MRISLRHLVVLAVGVLASSAPRPAFAQVEAEPVLRGAVRLGDAGGVPTAEGVGTGTVILHRVAPDTAGEVDSVRVAPDGSFSFPLPSVPDPGGPGEIYFASMEHHGILYFGDAVTTAAQLDSLYVITVHDTTAAPAGGSRLPVAVRYLVLEPATAPEGAPVEQGGGWRMTDLIQVDNAGDRTLVSVDGGPVWSYPLPAEARRVQVGQAEVGPDAAGVSDGRFTVRAPLPPGQRQFILRYALGSPELTIPMPGTTRSVELLVREPAPPLRVDGLEAAEAVAMDAGTTYRRYVGTDVRDGTVRLVEGEEERGVTVSPRWLAVGLALFLGVAGLYLVLRHAPRPAGAPPSDPAAPAGDRAALLLEVARIDERLEAGDLDPDEAERLRRRRAALVERLARSPDSRG